MKFTELNLQHKVLQGIEEAGFVECTEVQEKTLQETLQGKDVYVQSQTGTGKTATFLISIFQILTTEAISKHKKALILVPTRELAVQIEQEAKLLGKHLHLKIASFFGGVGYTSQEKNIKEGVDILIGTPGRLIDLFKTHKLLLHDIGMLVIDEADRMFDMGFIPDIRYIIKKMPSSETRHTMLFSATLNTRVRNLAWEYMNDPVEIEIAPENITVDNIIQELYHVGASEKIKLLLGILNKEKPQNVIIFANTKNHVMEISKRLEINGYPNSYIIGDLPQKKRQRIIDDVKEGRIKFLIATDVAARGLHVDNLDLVINYDLPEDCENYVHRIGRTARAGNSGKAISLACERYVYNLKAIENYAQIKIPVSWAEEDLYLEDKSAGMRVTESKRRRTGQQTKRTTQKTANREQRRSRTKQKTKQPATPVEAFNQRGKQKKKAGSFERKGEPFQKPRVQKRKNGSLEERLQYYRQKYGESFQATPEMLHADKRKKSKTEKFSFVKKLLRIFK